MQTCLTPLKLTLYHILLVVEGLSNGLVWFYGISTIVGYLMPNPFYTYIKYMISKHIS